MGETEDEQESVAEEPADSNGGAGAGNSPRIRTGRIGRSAGVGGMVARQGLGWAGTRIANLTRDEERSQRATDERVGRVAVQLARQLGEMKGAAMKIGQVLSTIELPGLSEEGQAEFRAALAQLRDNAPTFGFDDIRGVVEDDLGGKISDHFAEFEESAFAAASIGQVHRATTHDGERVAVKVQYPGVAEAVEIDLRNLHLILRLVKRMAPGLDAKAVGGEIRERISEELDYELEAQNHRALERAFRGHPFAVVPRVHTSLSSRRVLVDRLPGGRAVRGGQGDGRRDPRPLRRDRLPLLLRPRADPDGARRPAPRQLPAARRTAGSASSTSAWSAGSPTSTSGASAR